MIEQVFYSRNKEMNWKKLTVVISNPYREDNTFLCKVSIRELHENLFPIVSVSPIHVIELASQFANQLLVNHAKLGNDIFISEFNEDKPDKDVGPLWMSNSV